jgi:glycosyltransferase involved in cell wall biosynthesis
MNERCAAVLGWRDEPTDAVEQYCRYLGTSLAEHGIELEIIRVRWPELGWRRALRDLREKSRESQNMWFLVQYTALAWSRRGFPLRILDVIRTVKKNGARCAVVFHDPGPYPGNRLLDRVRRTVQLHTMRKAMRLADLAILTVPREKSTWIPNDLRNVSFIPVGANLACPEAAWQLKELHGNEVPTVAAFSVTVLSAAFGGPAVERIAEAMRYASAKLGSLRLAVLGRNSEIAGNLLREKLSGTRVEVVIHGLLTAEEIVRKLGVSDVLLFAGGPISTRRGSALAGISCGLPVIAAEGWETAPPITEAGVVLLPDGSDSGFGPALVRVLSDSTYRESLRERSRQAHQRYFSWAVIAAQYVSALRKRGEN